MACDAKDGRWWMSLYQIPMIVGIEADTNESGCWSQIRRVADVGRKSEELWMLEESSYRVAILARQI
jgi:hypothetical protein